MKARDVTFWYEETRRLLNFFVEPPKHFLPKQFYRPATKGISFLDPS
jgi:hypothetical protein